MTEIFTLPNGVRVALEPMSAVRSIACGIWVKSGSRNEEPAIRGMSHFIEHMLFKGTQNRSAKQIADGMDAIGGEINAYTSKEYTCYHTVTLDDNFEQALDILCDMFFHSKFAERDIKKERAVILEEMSMYEDSPEEIIYDNLQEQIWTGHSLGFPILGTKESLEGMNAAKMKQFYTRQYTPERVVISVAGHFETEKMLELIRSHFEAWTAPAQQEKSDAQDLPPAFNPQITKRQKDIEQVHICFGFPGVPTGSDQVYALAIFNAFFGGGMSSRLFQKIREERGLVYAVYSFLSNYKDTGLFAIYAGMGAPQAEEVVSLILKEIKNARRSKITEEKLSRIKEQFKSNIIIGDESTANRMSSIGRGTLLLNKVQTLDEKIKKIDAVTKKDIDKVYETVFLQDKMAFAAIGKLDGVNFDWSAR